MTEPRRVVVTGLGIVSPVGLDTESTWKNLLAGTSGIAKIALFDASEYQVQIAGEIKDLDPKQYMEHRAARRSGRFAQPAVRPSQPAICPAGPEIHDETLLQLRVTVGPPWARGGARRPRGRPGRRPASSSGIVGRDS